jgi:hypothetical protein
METLANEYVNAWVVAKHLPRIAKEAADPRVRSLAARAHAKYLYPVDSQVWTSDGELVDHVCANDLHGNAVSRYIELLDAPFVAALTTGGKDAPRAK